MAYEYYEYQERVREAIMTIERELLYLCRLDSSIVYDLSKIYASIVVSYIEDFAKDIEETVRMVLDEKRLIVGSPKYFLEFATLSALLKGLSREMHEKMCDEAVKEALDNVYLFRRLMDLAMEGDEKALEVLEGVGKKLMEDRLEAMKPRTFLWELRQRYERVE